MQASCTSDLKRMTDAIVLMCAVSLFVFEFGRKWICKLFDNYRNKQRKILLDNIKGMNTFSSCLACHNIQLHYL